MRPLIACIAKELRLLSRDLHGLALLFVLPLVFILVMSLAMQDLFAARSGHLADMLLIDSDRSERSEAFADKIEASDSFGVERAPNTPPDLRDRLRAGRYAFAVEILPGYGEAFEDEDDAEEDKAEESKAEASEPARIRVTVAADTDKRTEKLLLAALAEAAARQRSDHLIDSLPDKDPLGREIEKPELGESPIETVYAYEQKAETAPSAVQQNVPAWLVFAVFFVAIPFSNTFIRERQLGVQRRLRTINVGPLSQFVGKLIPYFVVNQLQVVLMLAVGVFLVPLLGGEALVIRGEPLALVLLAASVSLAALGFALLVAVVARTTEQATMLSGLGAILLAAIGGVMVPKFVMPEGLQKAAEVSPMAWGLDGFLELLLRDGGVEDIRGVLTKLAAFGLSTLALAWVVHRVRD